MRCAAGYNVFGVLDADLAWPSQTRRGLYFDLTLTATERLFGLLDE